MQGHIPCKEVFQDDLQDFQDESDYLSSLPDRSPKQEARLSYIRQRMENLEKEITDPDHGIVFFAIIPEKLYHLKKTSQ